VVETGSIKPIEQLSGAKHAAASVEIDGGDAVAFLNERCHDRESDHPISLKCSDQVGPARYNRNHSLPELRYSTQI
jgi:hypothetical protein